MKSKVMVALSGGVDSAVAALLLEQEGYDIESAYMKTWMNEEGVDVFGDCPWHQDIKDAEAVAKKIKIPFYTVDFIKQYKEEIVQYLVSEYANGRTPNPDIMCNRRMKFGKFLDYALSRNCDYVATGHYCSKIDNNDGTKDLLIGKDPSKDQSYFLTMITQEQLKKALFPIGSLLKHEVRDIARFNSLPNAEKKDSQGICFIGKIKIQDFLAHYIDIKEGDILNPKGDVIGKHKGLFNYTIGQRKGIGIPSNADNKNYVVLAKDFPNNRLIVGFEDENNKVLWKNEVIVSGLNWINNIVDCESELLARVRYRDDLVKIKFIPLENQKAKIEFDKPQRAIASGQVLAIYNRNILMGGAFFE